MKTSVGLLPEEHICRYHSTKMKPRVESTPRWQAAYAEFVNPRRMVYRCPVSGCPFIICGAQEYRSSGSDKQQMKSLEKA